MIERLITQILLFAPICTYILSAYKAPLPSDQSGVMSNFGSWFAEPTQVVVGPQSIEDDKLISLC